jgi:hypothetical protein
MLPVDVVAAVTHAPVGAGAPLRTPRPTLVASARAAPWQRTGEC